MPDSKWRANFRRKIFRWYDASARHLPWRNEPDPYRVWVSEIMLQQTQVETVKAYYAEFLKAFPTIRQLAVASEEDVLRKWEGLGYYRRARQMHAAAQFVVERFGGQFPTSYSDVLGLPGIGRYTAGAILSLSLDQSHPIVEANTVRLYSRLIGYRQDPTRSEGQKALWDFAQSIVPRKRCGDLNSAMMDLGSLICKPKNPECDACPVNDLCAANLSQSVDQIPLPKKKTTYTEVTEAAVVVRSRDRVLVRQCGESERWAGLWDFPRMQVHARTNAKMHRELAAAVLHQTGVEIQLGKKFTTMKHGVTRFRITLHCFHAESLASSHRSTKTQKWLAIPHLAELPLSVTGRKISRLLD